MSLPRLPDWIAPSSRSSIAPRASINRASRPRESRIRLAAREAVPVLYGRVIVPPKVFAAGRDGNHLVLGCLWGAGPLSTAPALAMRNGDPLPGAVQVAHELGNLNQTPHAWLQAAIPGYDDTLIAQGPGGEVPLAYSVLRLPADVRPDIQAEIIGPPLYDPRMDDVLWPALNPALWLLDWLSNPLYGCGQAVDWAGSIPAIDACDDLIDNEPRRWGGLLIDRAAPHASHVDALRTYAGCLIVPSESGLRLVPRRPAAVSRHVPAEQWIDSLTIERISRDQRPTVVTVQYTDTRAIPWTTGTARAYAPGVLAGTAPWRESSISLPGYQSHEVAYREAVERLNHATRAPYRIEGLATDEALRELPGDVITITHPDGLTEQPARVLSVQPEGPGRWRIAAEPYSAALYSDDVQGESNPIHTDLPDPSAPPPPVDALVVDEEVYQQQTGLYATRLRITWAASDWPYTQSYRVEVWQGEELVWRIETRQPEAVTGTLQELVAYTVRVMAVGPLTVGMSAEQSITAQGKYLPPSDVPELTGYEVGGEVHLAWQPATDVDIWRYEIAYGAVGGNLQSAALLDRVDGLRLVTRDVPAGPWRFYIRAIDSVGQYSANAAVCDLTVTLDSNAFLAAERDALPVHVVSLNGNGAYVSTPLQDEAGALFCSADRQWSVEAKFRATQELNSLMIIGRGGGVGSAATFGVYLYYGQLRAILRGQQSSIHTTPSLCDGAWHEVTISWDGAQAFAILDRGLPVSLGVGGANQQPQIVTLGAAQSGSLLHWKGQISDVRIWDIPLVSPSYTAPLPAMSVGLVAHYLLSDGVGRQAADSGPHGYHGTLIGEGARWIADPDSNTSSYRLRLDPEAHFITDHDAMISETSFADYADRPFVEIQPEGYTEWLSRITDVGAIIPGSVSAQLDYSIVRGTVAARIEASPDGLDWSQSPGLSIMGSYRYLRVRVWGTSPDALIAVRGAAFLRLDAQPRARRGEIQTAIDAPAHVVINETFHAAVFITLTTQSASAAYAVYDDVQVGEQVAFDIYAFDYQGNRLAVPVSWKFEGI